MTQKHDTGGPAYPYGREWNYDRSEISRWEENGMTLLDHFAGLAAWSLSAHLTPADVIEQGNDISRASYCLASDMIAEKRRRESNV